MDSETKLTSKLVKSWREMGAEVLNVHGNAQQAPGWPDCFVCHGIWTGWIEFKGPKTRLQPHQARIIQTLGRTENVWIVRFLHQAEHSLGLSIANNNQHVQKQVNLIGTDGQVAAKLLHTLARLDGVR